MTRQSKTALAAIVGLLVGLGTLAAVVQVLRDSEGTGSADPTPALTDTEATGETGLTPTDVLPTGLTRTVDVGGFPNAVAAGDGAVWVIGNDRRVTMIDPASARVVGRLGAGDELGSERPCGIAVGLGAVWIATVSGQVARLNLETARLGRMIQVEDAACVAVGAGSVWVTSPNRDLVTRIDPQTNDVVAEIPVAGFPQGIEVGFGSVWVAAGDPPEGLGGNVARIDPGTNEVVRTIPLDDVPEFLALGEGSVWVTSDRGTLREIDPRTNQLLGTAIQIADEGRTTVAAGGGAVWAAVMQSPDAVGVVVRIDPESAQVDGDPIPVGESPAGMAFGDGSLWVANYDDGTVSAITP